jgi:hypothetical protein
VITRARNEVTGVEIPPYAVAVRRSISTSPNREGLANRMSIGTVVELPT